MKKICPIHYSHTLDWIEYNRKYQVARKYKRLQKDDKRRKKPSEYINPSDYMMKRYKKDPKFRLNSCIAYSIWNSLKKQNISKNGRPWESLVNFTLRELINHLEDLFKNGMTWENHGKWHVDHIKPISLFNFKDVNDPEFKKCWALENLQPLWAEDNIRKSNKY